MKKLLNTAEWDPLAHRKGDDAWDTHFAEKLEAALRACITSSTLATITRHGRKKSFEPAKIQGVVESVHAHGFVVRGPEYRTFVTYVDLFCSEGRTTVGSPESLRRNVDEVCAQFRQRLPRGGGALFKIPPTIETTPTSPQNGRHNGLHNGKILEFEQAAHRVELVHGVAAESGNWR